MSTTEEEPVAGSLNEKLRGWFGGRMPSDWFAEPPYAGCQQRYRVLQRLNSETTPWQTLEVLDLEGPGRSLILGGTLGNGYDRVVYGTVTDFVNFHFWPVFNVADSAISTGVVLLIATYLLRRPSS